MAGGSIRQPCHNTGIAGLKPTHGRIPRTGSVFGDALGVFGPFNCYGPLARSVADLFLGLSIMSGPDLQGSVCGARAAGPPLRCRSARAAGRHVSRRRHLATHRRRGRCRHSRGRGHDRGGRRGRARCPACIGRTDGSVVGIGLPRRRSEDGDSKRTCGRSARPIHPRNSPSSCGRRARLISHCPRRGAGSSASTSIASKC